MASAAQRTALRTLIRAQRDVLTGDPRARIEARKLNRRILLESAPKRGVAPDADTGIQAALEVATYFRKNVVQAVREGDGTFQVRIRPETERGDNDTIRQKR